MNPSFRDARILVVDDEPANVALLEDILDEEGYTNVHSTTDPLRALDLYRSQAFDLMVLDVRMPKMSGIELMRRLSADLVGDFLPVLVLTAQIDDGTRQQALEAGARDFVTKPFKHWEVLLRIRNLLETRLYFNGYRDRAEILEEKVRERTRVINERNIELEHTRWEIIRRLGRAGEYRDNETGMHVMRMSKSSQRLALEAGLDKELSELILRASPMHDIGKIGIPDHILLKPGKLEPEEWDIMKTHVQIGADIIGDHDSSLMQTAKSIALTHHEKWDGSGYPTGLSGERIPIEGRICAVCDVFDALASERPYKKAWSIEKSLDLINDSSGSHFDPGLVEHFNRILPEILEIREKYAD